MNKENDDIDNSKINTDDGWNRDFYGSPSIGGFVVIYSDVGKMK
ncbi:hypothetical protein [Cytobacillus firmus]|nr:hypothetical protein [Cytobacillus firmus]